MENAVYWKGRQVGIECAGRISWFTSAPREAVVAYGTQPSEPVSAEQSMLARNLVTTASYG
ncbi:hypothetical protein [Paraburkholderia sp. BL21I4N1]|uniref:hypothetical protein n=1 Tax=Paraburkholderia sp. BL21I4N1 TaxID=1938801 RepID=UPI000CFB71D2|nr:hypothetical protein [Paraburkholderia sp. BL21I4N1]PQV52142.1 hypothetical protein B0G83_104359 [Paraburkholderia sp. BL21I4N1]